LKVIQLNAGYGELHVLFDIDFIAHDKKITTIVGPNGSGKSTLLKAAFSLATIHSGTILLDTRDITDIPTHLKARMGMAYLPQVENIFADLTVDENLKIAGYALDEASYLEGRELALTAFPELTSFLTRRAKTLSGGERQFLAIATSLVRKSNFLMLDEPTAQLSPKLTEAMFERIKTLRDDLGLTIILVEQDVRRALAIGNEAYVLVSGKVAYQGKAEGLIKSENFEKLCMGIC
jgi:branched-chain amino acid transport system ATP-binding protein